MNTHARWALQNYTKFKKSKTSFVKYSINDVFYISKLMFLPSKESEISFVSLYIGSYPYSKTVIKPFNFNKGYFQRKWCYHRPYILENDNHPDRSQSQGTRYIEKGNDHTNTTFSRHHLLKIGTKRLRIYRSYYFMYLTIIVFVCEQQFNLFSNDNLSLIRAVWG